MSWEAFGAVAGLAGGMLQNSANRKAADRQMRFQERMSNTAYQRSAKDLEKAGLNRILALGDSASSPGGAMPNNVNLSTSAKESAAAVAQIRLLNAQAQASIDNNYLLKTRNDILRAVEKGITSRSSAKDTETPDYISNRKANLSGNSHYADVLSQLNEAADRANSGRKLGTTSHIGSLPPVYGEPEKRAEYQRNNNSKNAMRSRQRDAYNKWLNAKNRSYAESQAWKKAHPLNSFKNER